MNNSSRIIIKDNTKDIKKDILSSVPTLTKKICNKTIEQLKKEGVFVFPEILNDSEDLSGNQIVLQLFDEKYRTGNIMGFLGCNEDRLTIESRFSKGNSDYFFHYMLEKVLEIPNVLELNVDTNKDDLLYNLLIFLFPYYLRKAMRIGLYKTYIRKKYNDSNVRGNIDIARFIKKNIPFDGKVSYSQREFSYDNYLMELIRHTIEYIKAKSFGKQLLRKVRDETSSITEVTNAYKLYDRRNIINENKKKPIRHAYYQEYRELQRLCIMILQNEKHSIGFENQQIHGILIDGAWLWEEYINTLICEKFYHPMNKKNKGKQFLFNRNKGAIFPDFISMNAEDRIIVDAKYKPIGNIKSHDYHQLLAYMFRFDSKCGYYVYPDVFSFIQEMKLNNGVSYEGKTAPREENIEVIKYGFHIPQEADSYGSFSKLIKKSEEKIKELFTSINEQSA